MKKKGLYAAKSKCMQEDILVFLFIDILPFFWFTISKLICDVNAMQHSMCRALY